MEALDPDGAAVTCAAPVSGPVGVCANPGWVFQDRAVQAGFDQPLWTGTAVTAAVGGCVDTRPDPASRGVTEAIDQHELFLVYQPITDLRTGELSAFEALVRWRHPQLGVLAPGQFLPEAERRGHMPALDWWVLTTACAEFAGLASEFGNRDPVRVNVNISSATLRRPNLDQLVVTAMTRAGLPASQVCLELAESADRSVLAAASDDLDWLHSMGVAIALDDMGAGSSTLKHLSLLSVTELKIDQSFVAGMLTNDRDHAVVRLLAELGRSLGINTVAEGVESPAQVAELDRLRVDRVQGHHIGRPEPVSALSAWLHGPASVFQTASPGVGSISAPR